MGWQGRQISDKLRDMSVQRSVAQRIAEARDERGMSNESLARAAGISVKTVSRIVNGQIGDPREDTLKRIAEALGISADELRGQRPTPRLGLAAGEDQVRELSEQITLIEAKLDEATYDRAEMRELIDLQNRLLEEQTRLIETMRAAVEELPALQRIVEMADRLGAGDVEPQPARPGGSEGGSGHDAGEATRPHLTG